MYLQDTGQTVEIGGGEGGSAINASLYFTTDPKDTGEVPRPSRLLVRCNAGEIKEGDQAVFGHYVNNRIRGYDGEISYTAGRYHGWVIPHQPFPLQLTFIETTDDGYDLWEVSRDDQAHPLFADYEATRNTEKELSLQKKSGISIYRNGSRLTGWLKFQVIMHEDQTTGEDVFTLSRWR